MERINNTNDKYIYSEHAFRYTVATQIINKLFLDEVNILDCACGIGYGSEILKSNCNICQYIGIDNSEKAINYANNIYRDAKCNFINHDINNISLNNQFDIIISFETLEHIENYLLVFKKYKNWLKPNGILIGSVPTSKFDNLCDETYGKNIYHISKFTKNDIESALTKFFKYHSLLISSKSIVNILMPINTKNTANFNIISFLDKNELLNIGSFFFCGSNTKEILDLSLESINIDGSIAEYDKSKLIPLINNNKRSEILVKERNSYINALEDKYEILNKKMKNLENIPLFRIMNKLMHWEK